MDARIYEAQQGCAAWFWLQNEVLQEPPHEFSGSDDGILPG